MRGTSYLLGAAAAFVLGRTGDVETGGKFGGAIFDDLAGPEECSGCGLTEALAAQAAEARRLAEMRCIAAQREAEARASMGLLDKAKPWLFGTLLIVGLFALLAGLLALGWQIGNWLTRAVSG